MIMISKSFLFRVPSTMGLTVVAMIPMAEIIPSPIPDTLEGYN